MIYHEPLHGNDICGIQVPKSYYDLIQRLAYKYNTSTRIISTLITNAGIHYFKDVHSDKPDLLNCVINAYNWYQNHKDINPKYLSKRDKKSLKQTKDAFDIK